MWFLSLWNIQSSRGNTHWPNNCKSIKTQVMVNAGRANDIVLWEYVVCSRWEYDLWPQNQRLSYELVRSTRREGTFQLEEEPYLEVGRNMVMLEEKEHGSAWSPSWWEINGRYLQAGGEMCLSNMPYIRMLYGGWRCIKCLYFFFLGKQVAGYV